MFKEDKIIISMDNISQMLTIIRNAQIAGHKEALVPASKLKLAVTRIMEREGFVESVSSEKTGNWDMIRIRLKYHNVSNTQKLPAIKGLRRISREGQRIYIRNKNIHTVKNRFGIAIISTSRGVMTGEESRKLGLGGEYICEIW